MSTYVQITNRCNMSCAHCLYSCTEDGEDMTEEVFDAAIKFADNEGSNIQIGGGEPLLHSKASSFIGRLIMDGYYVWLATNGTNYALTHNLLRIADKLKGRLRITLSQDKFHSAVDRRLIDLANELHTDDNYVDIRNVENKIYPFGRALTNGIYNVPIDEAECNGAPWVEPNGDIHYCCCPVSPVIGNVVTCADVEYFYNCEDNIYHECYSGMSVDERSKFDEKVLSSWFYKNILTKR